jgi:hypothetical protein
LVQTGVAACRQSWKYHIGERFHQAITRSW